MNQNYFLVTLVITACLFLEGYCAPQEQKNVTIKDLCIKETGISKDKVQKMEDESLEDYDEDSYCYVHCIFINMQLIDDKGKLDVKKTIKAFPDFKEDCLNKVPKIMECTDMANLDECEED